MIRLFIKHNTHKNDAMKKFIIPLLVLLVCFLGFLVYQQAQYRSTQELNEIVENAAQSSQRVKHIADDNEGLYVQKINADRHL